MNTRHWTRTCAAAIAAGSLLGAAGQAGAVTATVSATAQQTIKGWGCFPSYFRSDWRGGSSAVLVGRPQVAQALYNGLGITELRVDLQNRLYVSGTTLSDIVLQAQALTDLENQLQIARDHGVTNFYVSCYSPPYQWKDNHNTSGGHLIAADEPYFVNFYIKVLQRLQTDGFGLPVEIDVQNEPDMSANYDSCIYSDTQAGKDLWAKLVKDMRAALNANGMSAVKIGGPECTSIDADTQFLGGQGMPTLGSDPALNAAMDVYACHGYSECWITGLTQAQSTYPKDTWITEWSAINCPSTADLDLAVYMARHLAGNLVDQKANYWNWWRGWTKGTKLPGNEDLLSGDTTPIYSKRYWVLAKLFNTVRPGWVVKRMSCDSTAFITSNSADPGYAGHSCDTMVDLVGFENAGGTQSAVFLCNAGASAVTMTVAGLKGASRTTYQTDATHNMANLGTAALSSGSTSVTLPAKSVTIIVTS